MLGVEYSKLAERDFEAIVDWLSDYNPRAALLLIDRIEATLERLRDFPELGHQAPFGADDSLRVLSVGPWLLIYRVLPDRIFVSRIVRGNWNLPRIQTP